MITIVEIIDPIDWCKVLEGVGYIYFQYLLLIIFFLITKYIKNKNKNKNKNKKSDLNGV